MFRHSSEVRRNVKEAALQRVIIHPLHECLEGVTGIGILNKKRPITWEVIVWRFCELPPFRFLCKFRINPIKNFPLGHSLLQIEHRQFPDGPYNYAQKSFALYFGVHHHIFRRKWIIAQLTAKITGGQNARRPERQLDPPIMLRSTELRQEMNATNEFLTTSSFLYGLVVSVIESRVENRRSGVAG